jgi:hypothetical protein
MKRSMISLISLLPLSFTACGSSTTGDCTPGAGGNTGKYVVDSLTVPMQRTDYAIDLNGDGRVDNQLGNIIGALSGQGLNTQDGVTQAITGGNLIALLSETSADATYSNDTCAAATLQAGKTTPGMGPTMGASYMIDTSQAGGKFAGPITSAKFSSSPPSTTKTPVTVALQLPLIAGSAPLQLTVIGAQLTFTYSGGKLTGGQIHGAIKNTDVQGTIVPGVASLLTNKIKTDKASAMGLSSTDMQILQIFDTGGCTNADGTMATAMDQIISPCEVANNSIIKNVLAPDVQMFDASGNYAPNAANTTKDSLSLGLAFTAIPATF